MYPLNLPRYFIEKAGPLRSEPAFSLAKKQRPLADVLQVGGYLVGYAQRLQHGEVLGAAGYF